MPNSLFIADRHPVVRTGIMALPQSQFVDWVASRHRDIKALVFSTLPEDIYAPQAVRNQLC